MSNAHVWKTDDATYYGDAPNSTSNSDLKTFAQSPVLYHKRCVRKLPMWQFKATDDIKFGHRLHERIIDGRTDFNVTDTDGRSKAGKEYRDEFPDAMTSDDYTAMENMREAILDEPAARQLLCLQGKPEVKIRWDDDPTAMQLRCKLDWLTTRAIVDLKSTRCETYSEWLNDAGKLCYHRQAAFYTRGVFELTGEQLPFYFIVASKKVPYSVWVHKMGPRSMQAGETQVRYYLDRMAECRESDSWEPTTAGKVLESEIPEWHLRHLEWAV